MKTQVMNAMDQYEMLCQGDTVVLAVSGGIDSMVLCHFFYEIQAEYDLTVVVAHMNHLKRKEASLDEALVRQMTQVYGFAFEFATLPPMTKQENFHAYARDARYRFFATVCKKYGAHKVVTGHHGDDHLETLLGNLIKSRTPEGLIGIMPKGVVLGVTVIRPFITLKKTQLRAYAHEHQIDYLEDVSNDMDIYLRNRIRKYVAKQLRLEDEQIVEQVRELSDHLTEDALYFNEQLLILMDEVTVDCEGHHFSYDWLMKLPPSLSRRLVKKMVPTVSKGAFKQLTVFLANPPASGRCDLGNGMIFKKSYDRLTFTTAKVTQEEEFSFNLLLNVEQVLPDGKKVKLTIGKNEKNSKKGAQGVYLCYNSIRMPLIVRSRKTGDKIGLPHGRGRTTVKKVMIDKKIPAQNRQTWPIVVDASGVVLWIPGLRKSPVCLEKPNSDKDLWLEIYE